MDDLISRKAAMDCCFKPQVKPNAEIFNALKMAIRSEISALQSVDAAPVKHGRWVQEEDRVNHWHCSNCIVVWGVTHRAFKYCPNCGAKMDLEE